MGFPGPVRLQLLRHDFLFDRHQCHSLLGFWISYHPPMLTGFRKKCMSRIWEFSTKLGTGGPDANRISMRTEGTPTTKGGRRMRISDDRYSRDRLRFDLALRFM